jgi:hypothetical protein
MRTLQDKILEELAQHLDECGFKCVFQEQSLLMMTHLRVYEGFTWAVNVGIVDDEILLGIGHSSPDTRMPLADPECFEKVAKFCRTRAAMNRGSAIYDSLC